METCNKCQMPLFKDQHQPGKFQAHHGDGACIAALGAALADALKRLAAVEKK